MNHHGGSSPAPITLKIYITMKAKDLLIALLKHVTDLSYAGYAEMTSDKIEDWKIYFGQYETWEGLLEPGKYAYFYADDLWQLGDELPDIVAYDCEDHENGRLYLFLIED